MNPESDQGGSGISPIQMPKASPALFFFLFVRPPPWCSVLKGSAVCRVFPPRDDFCNERSLSPSRPLKRFEASRTHTPLPPPATRVYLVFGVHLFISLASPRKRTKGSTQKSPIKTRLALPLFFDPRILALGLTITESPQTPTHSSYPTKGFPTPRFRARHPISYF